MVPYLIPTQLHEGGGKVLGQKIKDMKISVDTGSRLGEIVVESGFQLSDSEHSEEYVLELDILVVSAGIRPRDERARNSSVAGGQRGGSGVNDQIQSSAGLLFGALMSYAFVAWTMKSVGKAANDMVKNCLRQFPKIIGPEKMMPGDDKCIKISTRASLRDMLAPIALVILAPLVAGMGF